MITKALVGCRNENERNENAGAIGWSITDADMLEIDAIFARHGVVTTPETRIEKN